MTKAGEIPQYMRIADTLRIRLRQLPVGAPFQTEQELTDEFGVSRGTVRQALDVLVHEGLLQRTQGRGSFRTKPNDMPYLFSLERNFADSIREIGTNSSIRKLSVMLVPASQEIAKILNVPRGTKVRRVTRIRTVEGEPFAYGVAYLRTDLIPAFYKRDYSTSLSTMLHTKLDVHFESRQCECYAAAADAEIAEALSIPEGSPILKLSFFCRAYGGEPMLLDTFCFPPSQTMQFTSPNL